MVCCSLQTSTSNPYSRRTFQQTAPSSSTKDTRPVWPNFPTNNQIHPHSWQQIINQRTKTTETQTTYVYARTGAGKLWIHRLHIVRANRYKGIHSNAGMASYQGGVVTSGVGIYTSSYFHHHMFSSYYHSFNKTGTAGPHNKSGMVAYQGGVVTGGGGIVLSKFMCHTSHPIRKIHSLNSNFLLITKVI